MTRFKTSEEFEMFKDTSMFCLCGRLMTGLHMMGCRRLTKEEIKIREREKQ